VGLGRTQYPEVSAQETPRLLEMGSSDGSLLQSNYILSLLSLLTHGTYPPFLCNFGYNFSASHRQPRGPLVISSGYQVHFLLVLCLFFFGFVAPPPLFLPLTFALPIPDEFAAALPSSS
jgi:hypothetical protein